jgi:hypothetical protein
MLSIFKSSAEHLAIGIGVEALAAFFAKPPSGNHFFD